MEGKTMKQNEIDYLNAMAQAKAMLKQGLINEKEYLKIEQEMAQKYTLNNLSLYRLNELLIFPFRAMYMIPNSKEVNHGENNAN